MAMELLDMEAAITKWGILEVKNSRLPSQKQGYDINSLWSETIFGKASSKQRKEQYGYINLKVKLFHPLVFNIVKLSSPMISKILQRKIKCIVNNGLLIENENGETGIGFLIDNFDKLDFKKICKENKTNSAEFIEKNRKLILIDKFLVIPAGYRDIDVSKMATIRVSSEINDLYSNLLFSITQLSGLDELDDFIKDRMQSDLIKISLFLKDRMRGKGGIFRSNMLKKRLDFSSRLILLSSAEVPMGQVRIPFHTALAIYSPIFNYKLFGKYKDVIEDIKNLLQKDTFDDNDFNDFIKFLIAYNYTITGDLKAKLITIAEEIVADDAQVLIKRDPVQSRNSYFSAQPTIGEGTVCYVNSVMLIGLNGDTFKGKIVVYDKDFKPTIVDTADFPNKYELSFVDNSNGNRWIYEIKDKIYTLSINPITSNIEYNLIKYWHVHTGVQFYKLSNNHDHCKYFESIIVGEKQSVWVYDNSIQQMSKIDISELRQNAKNYAFIKLNKHEEFDNVSINTLDCDTFAKKLLKKQNLGEISIIPAHYINIEEYNVSDYKNIKLDNLPNDLDEMHTGYDLTIDNNQKNFMHEEGVFICNSDGDTVCILPLFSDEAKAEAKAKLNPYTSKSKNFESESSDQPVSRLSLDAVATMYSITKN